MFARRTRTLVGVATIAIVLLATPSPANAGAADLSTARAATAGFHQLAAADDAGYKILVRDLAGITCITSPGIGVMGIHYVNGSALGDAVVIRRSLRPLSTSRSRTGSSASSQWSTSSSRAHG